MDENIMHTLGNGFMSKAGCNSTWRQVCSWGIRMFYDPCLMLDA